MCIRDRFSFYRIPKALFTEPNFRELSTDAKVLYGILLDRMKMCIRDSICGAVPNRRFLAAVP